MLSLRLKSLRALTEVSLLRSSPVLGIALGAVACSGAADVPGTPDFAALRAAYDQPNAELDETSVREVLEMAPDVAELGAGFTAFQMANSGVEDASSTAASKSGNGIALQGSIKVTLRCPGELVDPVYDTAVNGALTLTIAVESSKILRGVSGQASRCRATRNYFGRDVRVGLDGPFEFDLGGDIGLGSRGSGVILISIDGEITLNDAVISRVNGRLSPDGFESLFTLPDGGGTVILVSNLDGDIGIRDRSGFWHCNTVDRECARD